MITSNSNSINNIDELSLTATLLEALADGAGQNATVS